MDPDNDLFKISVNFQEGFTFGSYTKMSLELSPKTCDVRMRSYIIRIILEDNNTFTKRSEYIIAV